MRVSTAPLSDSLGGFVGNVVTFRDTSYLKQAERLRRESERR